MWFPLTWFPIMWFPIMWFLITWFPITWFPIMWFPTTWSPLTGSFINRVSTYEVSTDSVFTNGVSSILVSTIWSKFNFCWKVFCFFISLSFEGKQLRFAPEITIVSFQVHIWKFILDHVILALIENLSWSRYPLLSFILKEMDCGEMDFKNRAKQQQE